MPPADKAVGWGGSRERVRDGPHDRARRELAPCKPPMGGPPGVRTQGRKGDAMSHTANPPPPCRGTSAEPRACTVLATCIRQRTDSKGAPPHPPLPHPPRKGARTARGQRGDMGGGGAEDRPKRRGERRAASGGVARQPERKKKNKAQQRARAGIESKDKRGTAGTRERGKGRGKGENPGDESGEAGTNTAANRGGGGVTRARKRRW